jgi:hypothetical protein
MNGGLPQKIVEHGSAAKWSPDGSSIVTDSGTGLLIVEVGTGKRSEVPFSNDKAFAFWLDQETLGARDFEMLGARDSTTLLIFDLRTRKWTDLVAGSFKNWINSPDGKYVYFSVGGAEPMVQRIRVADHHLETITSLKDFAEVAEPRLLQLRVAPDGSPILTRAVDSMEIYALNVRWP